MRWVLILGVTLFVTISTVPAQQKSPPAVEYVKLEIVGSLETGVKAPGGETTGFVVKAAGVSYELDFGKNHELKQTVEKWKNKRIVVTGELSMRRGQSGVRSVIVVSSIAAVEP